MIACRNGATTAMGDGKSPEVCTRKWLLVVILCMVPGFFLFAAFGNLARGRATAICARCGPQVVALGRIGLTSV